MKKKLLYITTSVAALLLFNSCQNEEYVQPTADRAGITSLDAYFTSGVNKDKFVVDWKIDKTADMRSIPSIALMRREAQVAFSDWMKKNDKIEY